MTVPQPPPDDRGATLSAHDPWAVPRPPGRAAPRESVEERRLRRWADIKDAMAVLVLTAVVAGALLGLLWWWLAPRVPLITNGEALFPLNSESEEAIAADGTFLFLALGVGVVVGAVVFWQRSRGGVVLVLALAVGSLAAAVFAWRLGVWLDPGRAEVLARARELGSGAEFEAPLDLQARVALLGLPFGSLAVHAAATAIWGPRD